MSGVVIGHSAMAKRSLEVALWLTKGMKSSCGVYAPVADKYLFNQAGGGLSLVSYSICRHDLRVFSSGSGWWVSGQEMDRYGGQEFMYLYWVVMQNRIFSQFIGINRLELLLLHIISQPQYFVSCR